MWTTFYCSFPQSTVSGRTGQPGVLAMWRVVVEWVHDPVPPAPLSTVALCVSATPCRRPSVVLSFVHVSRVPRSTCCSDLNQLFQTFYISVLKWLKVHLLLTYKIFVPSFFFLIHFIPSSVFLYLYVCFKLFFFKFPFYDLL